MAKRIKNVLIDCSGSMGAQSINNQNRVQVALDMVYDAYTEGLIDGRTLIIPFNHQVMGGINIDMLKKMSRAQVEEIFKIGGGSDIQSAINYCNGEKTLLLTDEADISYGSFGVGITPDNITIENLSRLKPDFRDRS
jgi:hypothetical protein